jgi:uncharacterized membrane protein YdjX (TVP38/TMEM64 family)
MLLQFFDQLGGGYLFGLPVGFVADSIGATIGATAAFLLGRTVCTVNVHFSVLKKYMLQI